MKKGGMKDNERMEAGDVVEVEIKCKQQKQEQGRENTDTCIALHLGSEKIYILNETADRPKRKNKTDFCFHP